MKKQLTMAAIAGLFFASSAVAQDEALTDRQGDVVRDRWGDCIVTLDGTNDCHAPTVQNVSLEADAFFDFDKATLKPEGKARLDELVSQIQQVKHVNGIHLGGHTDGIGSQQYNLGLSERRAKAVEEYLVSRGVSPQLITTEGYGKLNPIVPNDTPANRAKNRRVDVVIKAGKVQK